MSLEKKLAELKKQRAQQAKTLHRTYVQTKRAAKRAMSPGRLIRKHVGASIGLALVAGVLMAPAPPPVYTVESVPTGKKKRRKGAGRWAWLLGLVKMFVPEAAALIPDLQKSAERATAAVDGEEAREQGGATEAAKEPPKPRSMIAPLVMELGMLLLQKVDWHALLAVVMQKFGPAEEHGEHHGVAPAPREQESAEPPVSSETVEGASQESPPTAN